MRIHQKQREKNKQTNKQKTNQNTILMISVQPILEHPHSICNCFRVSWCLWGQDLILNRMCLWCFWGRLGPAAPSGTVFLSFFLPLVTFSLFAVVSVLLQLGPFCLLLMLPLLCVICVSSGRVWPEGDDDASHVVTSCPISRCVGGQTVVQQLSGWHMGCRNVFESKVRLQVG